MSMKIVAGIGSIDDYEDFVRAGADECFCGYVPGEYMIKYGRSYPANRREVIYYNVQIGSESELLILKKMIERHRVPVSIAFNGLYYGEEQRKYILETAKKCVEMGYTDFIVAEPELLCRMGDIEGARLTVSGELGELNEGVIRAVKETKVRRYIYPRQTSIEEMALLGKVLKEDCEAMEAEAFVLNEKCHFTGAYCNSLHCDELCHMCKVPYRLCRRDEGVSDSKYMHSNSMGTEEGIVGATGCALCLLWQYREAGVTHLKVVSRGNASEATCEDIRVLRRALDILEECASEQEYKERLFAEVLMKGCSGNCYTRRYDNLSLR